MIAIAYTLSFCFLGAQMIRWLMPRKSPLVRAWLGVSLGVLMEMGLPALCANALDFTVAAHIAAVAAALLLAALCYAAREKAPLCRMSGADRRQMAVMAAVGIPLTALSAYLQYTHNIMPAADGSLWCGQATYGDLCMHLSFVTSLKNMRFPPSYSLLAGTSLAYPYLTDALSTTFYMLGMPLNLSLVVPGTLLMALTYAGYMLLARQILGGSCPASGGDSAAQTVGADGPVRPVRPSQKRAVKPKERRIFGALFSKGRDFPGPF